VSDAIMLRTTSPRRWRGNGFGYERASYEMLSGGERVATVVPYGYRGWRVTLPEGPAAALFYGGRRWEEFSTLAEVRVWGNEHVAGRSR
jgi:hypothetical protein